MANLVINIEKPFNDIFQALDLKGQRKAMRGAMRREGNRLKGQAVANLKKDGGFGQGTGQRLSKGIRMRVYPDKFGAGFMLSVKPNKKQGYHKNRQGLEKPVLMWAEDGTKYRKTKTKTKVFARKRKGHVTGRMKRYGFMPKTDGQAIRIVEQNLFSDFQKNLERAARKKGLL